MSTRIFNTGGVLRYILGHTGVVRVGSQCRIHANAYEEPDVGTASDAAEKSIIFRGRLSGATAESARPVPSQKKRSGANHIVCVVGVNQALGVLVLIFLSAASAAAHATAVALILVTATNSLTVGFLVPLGDAVLFASLCRVTCSDL